MPTKAIRLALLASLLTATGIASAQTVNLLTEEAYPFQYLEDKKLTGMAAVVVN